MTEEDYRRFWKWEEKLIPMVVLPNHRVEQHLS